MTQPPLILAVVGHTNTGKTSLIRTLLRNPQFGQVADAAGTTRHVEAASLDMQGRTAIEWHDTPGLEDSQALHALLARLQQNGSQQNGLQGRQCLTRLLEDAGQWPAFEQEFKVLRQALVSDALLYVIDCRDAVLDKYKRELQCLALASRPILPVLNFIHSPQAQTREWQHALAELGLHAQVSFDTVAFSFDSEKRLYQKLQTLLEARYDTLQTLIQQRENEWQSLRRACCHQVANLLIDAATHTLTVPANPPTHTLNALRDTLRGLEQACLTRLLALLNFSAQDVALTQLPVTNGEWQLDLFAPETLKAFGLDAASAAATGAAVGVGVDLIFAGMTLGAAALTGAALGTAWHTGKRYGSDLLAQVRGHRTLCADDATLTLLLVRQLSLLRTLFQRGHAAQNPVTLPSPQPPHTGTASSAPSVPETWPAQRKALRRLSHLKIRREDRAADPTRQALQNWLVAQL